jgi:hypothetical protein
MIQGQMCVSNAQSCLKRSVVPSDDIVESKPGPRKTSRSCSKSLLNLDCYKEKSIQPLRPRSQLERQLRYLVLAPKLAYILRS